MEQGKHHLLFASLERNLWIVRLLLSRVIQSLSKTPICILVVIRLTVDKQQLIVID